MQPNLMLDENTHDLLTQNYNLRLTATLAEEVAQRVECRLKTWLGEWWLNPAEGVPYYQQILRKNADLSAVRGIFLSVVRATVGVDSVERLELSLGSDRTLGVYIEFTATDGTDGTVNTEVSA